MNTCKFFQENLIAFAANDLSTEKQTLLQSHLAGCTSCRELFEKTGAIMQVIERQKLVEPRDFAATRLLQRIESVMENKRPATSGVFLRILQPAIIGLIFLVALSAGILIGSNTAGKAGFSNDTQTLEIARQELNIPEYLNDDIMPFNE